MLAKQRKALCAASDTLEMNLSLLFECPKDIKLETLKIWKITYLDYIAMRSQFRL